jgi:uncharacterized protein YbjT (DUF2867 family)
MSPSIVIAGASGFIGRALIEALLKKFPSCQIKALSRSTQKSSDPRLLWQPCDLFSENSIAASLPQDIDVAFYLVHSMSPTAKLDQGSFADYDLLLADNFARALKKKSAKQLIYLGGLIPQVSQLSQHLASRLEVEEIFASYELPLTVFRAGLILGEEGSSAQILLKLVRRLPMMICPSWTQNLTTPVDLPTVIQQMTSAVLRSECLGKVYDVAGCKSLTYLEMMRETGSYLGLTRWFIKVPFFTPTLSRLWVSLITQTSKNLVYPLIESLEHPMVARTSHVMGAPPEKSFSQMLESVNLRSKNKSIGYRIFNREKTVRSVQRLNQPPGKTAPWVAREYFSWLPSLLKPFLKVVKNNSEITLCFLGMEFLKMEEIFTSSDFCQFRITGGLLVAQNNRGTLEFRDILNHNKMIVAIHDFRPSLPWYIYKYTQAILHIFVMRAFNKHLEKIGV